jgi:predicted nucleic acid-binding protein
VFAELMAAPGRSEAFVGLFFEETGIAIDWQLGETVWRFAGRALRAYAERRRKRDMGTRRILADFLIGAHAVAMATGYLRWTIVYIAHHFQPLRS